MPWLLQSPGHQQPCYWLCRTNIMNYFDHLHHPTAENWQKMLIYFYIFSKQFSTQRVKWQYFNAIGGHPLAWQGCQFVIDAHWMKWESVPSICLHQSRVWLQETAEILILNEISIKWLTFCRHFELHFLNKNFDISICFTDFSLMVQMIMCFWFR